MRISKYGQLIPSLEEGAAVDVAEFFAGLDDNRLLNLFEAIQESFKVVLKKLTNLRLLDRANAEKNSETFRPKCASNPASFSY